jgi:2-amino-4-hydroxy-6-hydroxymethyldihydropteridine diphosphokinase
MAMATVYLALGSNVGDSPANIAQAVKLLGTSVTAIKQAPMYLSKAVGYTNQADFFNTALAGRTALSPEALLDFIKAVEQQVGRTPSFHWGPREIDIDLVFYDDLVKQTEKLTIPHPRFQERDFVLQPLADLDPSLIDPASGQTIQNLLAKLTPQQKSLVQRVDADT